MGVVLAQVEGPKLANMLHNGKTPILPPKRLQVRTASGEAKTWLAMGLVVTIWWGCGVQEIGFTIAAYPLCLLSASIKAMRETLDLVKKGEDIDHLISTFDETKTVVGFDDYYVEEARYAAKGSEA